MNRLGVIRATDLRTMPDGVYARVARSVIARQRPGTAEGFIFLSFGRWNWHLECHHQSWFVRTKQDCGDTGEVPTCRRHFAESRWGYQRKGVSRASIEPEQCRGAIARLSLGHSSDSRW
jgi:hypothetical protein